MLRQFIQRLAAKTHMRPRTFVAASILMLLGGWLLGSVLIPRHVAFSYGGDTCVQGVYFLPGIQSLTDKSSGFKADFQGGFSIGSTRLLATSVCFTPTSAPSSGSHGIAMAPWGGIMLQRHYVLEVGAPPRVSASKLPSRIAATKPLTYTISEVDRTYAYAISAYDKSAVCSIKDTALSCDLAKLALDQGLTHEVTLTRTFMGSSDTKLLKNEIHVLPAVTVVATSPLPNATIYEAVSTMSMTLDKPLTYAAATLAVIEGDARTPLPVTTTFSDTVVSVASASPLQREKTFELTLSSAEATDGSMISAPYVVTFNTSGGPKVRGVSIGSSVVDPNARIVVTLDQAIADSVDIAKYARISGVPATITKQGAQVIYTLSQASRCSAFTLTLDKGITSATNGMTSKDTWSYSSRIDCGRAVTIGYSVKGRAINAYYYGSGNSTILFTGGMHGSEPSGYATMLAWASHLDTYAYQLPANTQVVVVPNTNPDGIATGSRYNANGVNIDRNFATDDWQTDIETADGHKAGGGGSAPASEPETKGLAALTAQLRPRLEVSYHAQGRLVGANQVGISASRGSTYANTVGYATMYGNAEELMGYTITGEYETWIGEKLGLPAILIELPSHSGNYFNAHRTAIWQLVNS